MVAGLENIYSVSEFTFKGEQETHYKIDKTGHQLIEFRGEKISGALDFISKIIEFDKIAEIKSFITRIENANRKIQPLLIDEIKNIKLKLTDLNAEIEILRPKYLKLVADNQNYIIKKDEVKKEMIISKELDWKFIDNEKLHKTFLYKYPEFEDFEKEFANVLKNYNILIEQIQNFNKLSENITTYNIKILKHFGT